jgi:hypothetical protein
MMLTQIREILVQLLDLLLVRLETLSFQSLIELLSGQGSVHA